MSMKALARREDAPGVIIIGPTLNQLDEMAYRKLEIERLQEEISELNRRLDHTIVLERFRDALSLECPRKMGEKITIIQCREARARRDCIQKKCIARTMLLAKISL